MELNFINATNQKKWNHYRKELVLMLKQTIDYFSLNENSRVSCVLVDDEAMINYNHTFRQLNQTTDVLTFVEDDEANYLGDIIINVDALVHQAQTYQHTLKREMCFLFVHGLLHTLGFDHQSESDEKIMFTHQKEILKHVPKRSYRKLNPQV